MKEENQDRKQKNKRHPYSRTPFATLLCSSISFSPLQPCNFRQQTQPRPAWMRGEGGRSRRVGPGSPQVNPEETERRLSTDFSPLYPLSPVRKDTPRASSSKHYSCKPYASTKPSPAVRQYIIQKTKARRKGRLLQKYSCFPARQEQAEGVTPEKPLPIPRRVPHPEGQ